jgi:hypothetical protein
MSEYISTAPRRTISLKNVRTICINGGLTLWFEKLPYRILESQVKASYNV